MRINAIGGENIYSFKELYVPMGHTNLCSITGENRDTNDSNGSGKSSLIDIPRYVLFKKSAKKNVLRDGAKTGSVMLVLDQDGSDILVERQFPGDKIKINGQDASQHEVNQLVGLDDMLFCNTVYYRQEAINMFAASTPAKQMELITAMIPDLVIFDKVRKFTSVDRDIAKEEVTKLQSRMEELDEVTDEQLKELQMLLGSFDKDIEKAKRDMDIKKTELDDVTVIQRQWEKRKLQTSELKSVKKNFDDEKEILDGYKKHIAVLKEELENLDWENKKVELKGWKEKHDKTQVAVIQANTELQSRMDALDMKGICPTCQQMIDKHQQEKYIKPEMARLKKKIQGYDHEIQTCDKKMEELEGIIAAGEDASSGIKDFERQCEHITRNLKKFVARANELKKIRVLEPEIPEDEVDKKMEELSNEVVTTSAIYHKLQLEQHDTKRELEKCERIKARRESLTQSLKEHSDMLAMADYWYKQIPIIKVRIIDDNIALMEASMNGFMSELYPTFNVKLDSVSTLKSGETRDKLSFQIVTDLGEKRDWMDLSGGEKSRIALGCQMSAASLLRVDMGFEIYDEVFKGMDDSGIESTANLMRQRSEQGKQVFAISHNKDACSYFDDNIHVVKEKGVSSVKS